MPNYLWRSLFAIFGICAIAWAVNVVPVFRTAAPLAQAAEGAILGYRFNATQLSAMKRLLDTAPARTPQATDLSNVVVVRLLLLEDQLRVKNQPSVSELVELQTAARAAIDQSPTNSFMWLAALWLQRLRGGSTQTDLNLLRMSYWSGPNEAWIAIRRNGLVVSMFPSLPSDISEQALLEFVGLVRSGLYADASNILAGPGWAIHEQLLSRLIVVDEANRRGFARALASKGLDSVVVPGVEDRPSRPF